MCVHFCAVQLTVSLLAFPHITEPVCNGWSHFTSLSLDIRAAYSHNVSVVCVWISVLLRLFVSVCACVCVFMYSAVGDYTVMEVGKSYSPPIVPPCKSLLYVILTSTVSPQKRFFLFSCSMLCSLDVSLRYTNEPNERNIHYGILNSSLLIFFTW